MQHYFADLRIRNLSPQTIHIYDKILRYFSDFLIREQPKGQLLVTHHAWGILKAVVQDRIGVRSVARAKLKDFVGTWVITDIADRGEAYWADEPVEPTLRLEVPRGSTGLWGAYEIGLSSGSRRAARVRRRARRRLWL